MSEFEMLGTNTNEVGTCKSNSGRGKNGLSYIPQILWSNYFWSISALVVSKYI